MRVNAKAIIQWLLHLFLVVFVGFCLAALAYFLPPP